MRISEVIKQEKTQSQITKLLCALIVCVSLLLVVEIVFQIPIINDAFSTDALSENMGDNKIIWLVLWLLMFAQVTIIPVPSMPIYVFCNRTYLVAQGAGLTDLFSLRTLFFVAFVTSASVVGSIVAYGLGKLGGRKAVRWIAGDEDDYNKWSKALNCKTGKYIYAATVVFPIFPDDVLCLVAGALKIDFKFFLISNILGKLVGAFCLLMFLRVPYLSNFFQGSVDGGFPWAIVVYSALLLCSTLTLVLWKRRVHTQKKHKE